jgi:hypothetical protein
MLTTQSPSPIISSLYDRDYCLWADTMANLLRTGKFSELDIENLVDEIEDMSKSEKRALANNLVVILLHLLKYQYQPQLRSNSWKASIREHRRRLRIAFKDSPSLKRHFEEVFEECYQDARKEAADETGLPLDTFPLISPFTALQSLDQEFLPETSIDL